MIIRRKHTANFTTIGNALFEDKRLSADEVGVLAWLLSRHHDWEVRRPALMRRWDIGTVSMKRIINSWMRCGWCQAKKTRLSNGTFSIIYEIRDEPGPELTEDDIRAALSLVSSEAGDDESTSADGPDQPHAGDDPPPCQRGVDDQRVVDDGVASKKKLLKTDSIKTESTNGGRAFAEVQAIWPSDKIVSAFACEQVHAALSEALQEDAFNGAKPYLADCAANRRMICDLATYYRERRWEKFLHIKPNAQITTIKPVGPNFERWREYYSRTNNADGLKAIELMAKLGRDITVPSPWPPALPPQSSSAA